MRRWYEIKNADEDEAEILIYDTIGTDFWGDGVSAKAFIEELGEIGSAKDLHVRINSPGGDVFEGTAIYNALRAHAGDVRVSIDGVAASMASMVAMAGEAITMPANALMMIHNPWTFAIGDEIEMLRVADVLGKSKAGIVSAYAMRTGKTRDDISDMMDAETWMTGEEALEAGFATEATAEEKMAACAFDLSGFKRVPDVLSSNINKIDLPAEPTGRKVAVARRRLSMISVD